MVWNQRGSGSCRIDEILHRNRWICWVGKPKESGPCPGFPGIDSGYEWVDGTAGNSENVAGWCQPGQPCSVDARFERSFQVEIQVQPFLCYLFERPG